MAKTKSDLLLSVSANVNGTASVPEGDELTLWGEFLESANQEWAHVYDSEVLIKTSKTTILQSGTSVAMSSDFKEKLAGLVDIEGDLWEEYSKQDATRTTGDYVTWGGDQNAGYYLNTSRALYSTCKVKIPYHSRPTSLSTLTSVSPIPDPEFLVARVSEKAMMQRGQPKYVEFQIRAELLLQRMVANEVSTDIGRNNQIRTQAELDNFTLGDD